MIEFNVGKVGLNIKVADIFRVTIQRKLTIISIEGRTNIYIWANNGAALSYSVDQHTCCPQSRRDPQSSRCKFNREMSAKRNTKTLIAKDVCIQIKTKRRWRFSYPFFIRIKRFLFFSPLDAGQFSSDGRRISAAPDAIWRKSWKVNSAWAVQNVLKAEQCVYINQQYGKGQAKRYDGCFSHGMCSLYQREVYWTQKVKCSIARWCEI